MPSTPPMSTNTPVRGHGLDNAVIVLADLDALPDGGLSSLTLLVQHGLDGADDAAAGTVDLGHAELDLLLDHLAKVGVLGHARSEKRARTRARP